MLPVSPPPPPSPPALLQLVENPVSEGDRLLINGQPLPVRWRFEPGTPGQLWLPLDLLEAWERQRARGTAAGREPAAVS